MCYYSRVSVCMHEPMIQGRQDRINALTPGVENALLFFKSYVGVIACSNGKLVNFWRFEDIKQVRVTVRAQTFIALRKNYKSIMCHEH